MSIRYIYLLRRRLLMTERIEIYFVGDFGDIVFGMHGLAVCSDSLGIQSTIDISECDVNGAAYAVKVIPITDDFDLGAFMTDFKTLATRSIPISSIVTFGEGMRASAYSPITNIAELKVNGIFDISADAFYPISNPVGSILPFGHGLKARAYHPKADTLGLSLENYFGLARRILLSNERIIKAILPFKLGANAQLLLPYSESAVCEDVTVPITEMSAQVNFSFPMSLSSFVIGKNLGLSSKMKTTPCEAVSVSIESSTGAFCAVSLAPITYLTDFANNTLGGLSDTKLNRMFYILN